MVRLALTIILIDEDWVDTLVPCPWQLGELVQSLFEFAHKVFFPFLYKFLHLIHIDLHFQYYIKNDVLSSIYWISQYNGRSHYKMVMMMNVCNGDNDEFGYKGNCLMEIYFGHLRIFLSY